MTTILFPRDKEQTDAALSFYDSAERNITDNELSFLSVLGYGPEWRVEFMPPYGYCFVLQSHDERFMYASFFIKDGFFHLAIVRHDGMARVCRLQKEIE
jgi:hypothetical protein